MPYEYYRIRAGAPSEPGIDGGVGRIADAPLSAGSPMTHVTAPVANIDEALERVLHAGGRVVQQKLPIPGVGWYATCAEPRGLHFGLIQADQSANPSR